MKASARALGPQSVELRTHPDGAYGDPWSWGCVTTPKANDPLTAWLTLMPRAPGSAEIRAVVAALKALGYTHWQGERIKGGVPRHTRKFRL